MRAFLMLAAVNFSATSTPSVLMATRKEPSSCRNSRSKAPRRAVVRVLAGVPSGSRHQ